MTRRWAGGFLVALAVSLVPFAGAAGELRAATPPPTRTLQVFAAASLSDAFTEIARQLEREQSGLRVRIQFAGSQQLAFQFEQGAVADVFASADERWMLHVTQRGLLRDSARVFARNQLVVILPGTNPARIQRLQDLARAGIKLVLGADVVPVGRYSRTALQRLARDPAFGNDFATRVLGNVVSEEENVRGVVGKVQLGEADAGIVYRSDVTPAVSRFVRVLELPNLAQIEASYSIATLGSSTEPKMASVFVEYVLGPDGRRVLRKHGLLPAVEQP